MNTNLRKFTFISKIEATSILMPGLPKECILPDSVLDTALELVSKNMFTLQTKAKKKLDAAKKRGKELPAFTPSDLDPILGTEEIAKISEEHGNYPNPQYLELLRLEILRWMASKGVISDVYRLWARNRKKPDESKSDEDTPPPATEKEEEDVEE